MKNVILKEFEIKGEEWKKILDEAFKKEVKDAKVDGFRKGKVPKDIYLKNFGMAAIYREAMDLGVDDAYKKVLEENKDIIPVIQPSLDVKDINEEHIVYEFKFIVRPEVKLGKYKNLGVKKEEIKVSKKEIDDEIENLRNRFAEVAIKENGEVVKGNTVVIDFEGFLDGKTFEGGKGENYPLEIGSNTFIPGFEDGLVGMKSGEEKDLNLKFPDNYTEELKGKDVVFKVKVNEIKERILPNIDKYFFEDLGYKDIKTEEEFKKKIEEEIKHKKEHEVEDKYINECVDKALDTMEVEINEEIIHEEIHRIMDQATNQLQMQGITLEQYLSFSGKTMDDFHKEVEPEAIKRIKERYLLEEIAELEKIEINDKEADEEAKRLSEMYGMTKEELIKEFGGVDVIKYDLKMRKAIDILKG